MWPMPEIRARAPRDSRIYAIGDIHGSADLLDRLHDLIRADAARAPESRRVVVYLGDYVDRGPDSAGVIERLVTAPLAGFESVFLKGNHEDFMRRFLDDAAVGRHWLMNGGGATLASYGVAGVGDGDLFAMRDALRGCLPAAHLAFLDGLSLYWCEGDYVFVHAGIRPDVPLARQGEEDLLWIREPFLSSVADHGAVIVHGHTPVESPELQFNRIDLDTGAVWSGRLTALVMYGAERKILQT